jgi:hypothetical protein
MEFLHRCHLLTSIMPPSATEHDHLIAQHRKALVAHTNWIIDVRDNDGGNDSTYYPLLPWLMPDQRESVGAT